MMNAILRLMTAVAVPLGLFNALGGIVAGIWLALLGEWGAIGWGLAALVFTTLGMSFALMPGLAIAVRSPERRQQAHRSMASVGGCVEHDEADRRHRERR